MGAGGVRGESGIGLNAMTNPYYCLMTKLQGETWQQHQDFKTFNQALEAAKGLYRGPLGSSCMYHISCFDGASIVTIMDNNAFLNTITPLVVPSVPTIDDQFDLPSRILQF